MPFDSAASSIRRLTRPQDLLPRIEDGDETITEQEIFEGVAWHLKEQAVCSVELAACRGRARLCVFRGPDGLRCAVGALIPDSAYSKSFEGKSFRSILKNNRRLRPLAGHLDVLRRLQTAHDEYMPHQRGGSMKHVWRELREVAVDRSLDASFLDAWELEAA